MPEGLNQADIDRFRSRFNGRRNDTETVVIECCDEIERVWSVVQALLLENQHLRQANIALRQDATATILSHEVHGGGSGGDTGGSGRGDGV